MLDKAFNCTENMMKGKSSDVAELFNNVLTQDNIKFKVKKTVVSFFQYEEDIFTGNFK